MTSDIPVPVIQVPAGEEAGGFNPPEEGEGGDGGEGGRVD